MRMPDIERAIDDLAACAAAGECAPVLHFNSGLHDLDKYCGDVALSWRREQVWLGHTSHPCNIVTTTLR